MLDAITEPFQLGIGQRALIEVLLLGAVCGPLGVWIVLYRESYAAESLAHGMLPGLVIASLAGIALGVGGAIGLLVAASGIWLASRQSATGPDVAVAVVVTSLFGVGVLLALARETPARLSELLFGNPLAVTSGDLFAAAGLVLGVLLALAALHRPLALGSFDPQTASNLGSAPAFVGLALLVLLALTTLVAVQALGNLLVVALIVGPAAAALQLSRRLESAMALSAGLAVAAGVGGLYVSHYLDLAVGASIALFAIALFAVSVPLAATLPTPQARRALPSPRD